MTDAAPSWQSDPTGRHDHRYWDGSAWTEHVADAGVSGTDPYDGPSTPPEVPASAPEPGAPASAVGPSAAEPTDPGEATSEATETSEPAETSEPTPAASVAVPPLEAAAEPPTGPAGPEPVDPAATTDGAVTDPTLVSSGWSDPTTQMAVPEGAPDAAAEPTVAEEPTEEVPVTAATIATPTLPDAPPADGSPAQPAGGDGGGRGPSRLVVGIAVVAVAALVGVIVLLASGGGSSSADSIAANIAKRLETREQLTSKDASCVAHRMVTTLGTSTLKGVDFSVPDLPARLEPAFSTAQLNAAIGCKVDVAALSPKGGSSTSTTGDLGLGGLGIGGLGDISAYTQLLANIYQSSFHLSADQASCLATSMTDAITKGKVPQADASSSGFFSQFLDHCHISLNDLSRTPGTG